MPISFPLGRGGFFGQLPVSEQRFQLGENVEVSGLGEGSILRDQLGPRLWSGNCMIDRMNFDDARSIIDRIELLLDSNGSFLIWRLDSSHPVLDPKGSIISGASPEIHQLESNNVELQISGLPAGYELRRGDMFSFQYGSNPVRYALHRVSTSSVVADGSGTTPTFEVRPHIRPGATIGAAVEFDRPHCKAIIVPGSYQPGSSRRTKLRSISFDFIQTLRA
ncbi:MAG: hypothetical protein ACU0FH_02140 [Heliomarina sp.]|uniref:hypothetical protein n=1 Tax=Heliomarina sp. TaxID=2917556 RepID=UPI004057E8BF